jgi:F-type H+-transporting ATPase subunit delta
MKTETIANRYANGLFLLAKESNQIQNFQTQITAVLLAFKEDEEIVSLLNHYRLSEIDKFKIVDQVFGKELDSTLINFLKLLLQKQRFNHFIKIAEEFNSLVNTSLGIKEGIVYSSVKLSDQQMKNLTQTLLSSHKMKVELKNKIDSRLIGGYKIIIGDTIFDGSLRNRLETMRQELSKGK